MPLKITKVGEDKYLAVWTDAKGQILKSIDAPRAESELTIILSAAGCHRIDIYDALELVSPKIPAEVKADTDKVVADLVKRGVYKPAK